MAEYEVRFVTSAAKEFRSLPTDIKRRIGVAVETLRRTPRPVGVRKLHGYEYLYRIRVGQYRIVYEIDPHYQSAAQAGSVSLEKNLTHGEISSV
jgi:mRNA interferase RelE/StbE